MGVAGATVLQALTFATQLPLNATVPNPCVPEDVFVQGHIDITVQQNFDNATGSHFDQHFVSKGTGIGLITGATYVYSEETENSLQIPGPPQTVAQDFVINHLLIANGTVPNFYLFIRVHTTLNALGVPTANIVSFGTKCN